MKPVQHFIALIFYFLNYSTTVLLHIPKYFLLLLFSILFKAGCAQSTVTAKETVYITEIKTNGKAPVISVDYVQMLTGKPAINAAKLAGEAEYEVNSKADTTWYVPNDFYLVNKNKAIRKASF